MFPIKQGDRFPFLTAQLTDNGVARNLTGATVMFVVRYRESGQIKFQAAATITDAINGWVQYQWAAGDTAEAGTFDYEFVASFSGVTQTFPAEGYGELRIQGASLGYIDQRAEVQQSAVDSLVYFVRKEGAPLTPDTGSVWVTVLDPSGNVKQARTQTGVTLEGSRITYTRTWGTEFELLWEDYVLVVEWQETGVTRSDRLYFDVVRTKLSCPVTNEDVLEMYPDMDEHIQSVSVTHAGKFIRRAWSQLLDAIRSGHNRPSLILDRARLVNPTLHLALHFLCNSLTKNPQDVWYTRARDHKKQYDQLLAGLGELKYDRDEDGLAGNDETKRMNRRRFQV